jgi:aerobic carbon-monoxide dehydrogenase large subunit
MYIGRPLPRLEDDRLLTGRGRYTDDERFPDEAWCVFVRSPHARARIRRIETDAARRAPGVLAVLNGADYRGDGLGPVDHVANPIALYDINGRAFAEPRQWPHWPLAEEEARHVGEPVAAVIAKTGGEARDAAELVHVDYEALDPVEALCFEETRGDPQAVERALASAAHVLRHEFVNQRIANCQMEPRSAIGIFDDGYTLITATQGVVLLKQLLSRVLGTEQIRVVSRDVGGGFGPRTYLQPEQVVVLWAAKRLGLPVRWTSERSEAFLSDFQGRDSSADVALGLDADGRIVAYKVVLKSNVGAHTVSFVPASNFRNILTTAYRVPAACLTIRAFTTNTLPTVPYRGAGRPEAHHLIERLLDIAARRLGIDRAEIRRRNLVRKDELPYRNPMGLAMEGVDFHAYMARALELASYSRKRKPGRGIGIANYLESPVGAPGERVELHLEHGSVKLIAGTQSSGQGHETSFAQLVAEKLGVLLEKVRVMTGDTGFVRVGGGTHSDRSIRYVGNLALRAADNIVEQGRAAAAAKMEVQAADLVFDKGDYRVAGTDRSLHLFDVAPLLAAEEIRARIPAYPGGCAVCEVEVDRETGEAKIVAYTTVDDVGQAINPLIVHGQTHGGIAQGVGQALVEGVVFDAARQVLTGSWTDYGILRAENLPSFSSELVEEPTRGNALRIKGGGEGGTVPATAAVINALCDALDLEDLPMPATAHAVWRALQARKS